MCRPSGSGNMFMLASPFTMTPESLTTRHPHTHASARCQISSLGVQSCKGGDSSHKFPGLHCSAYKGGYLQYIYIYSICIYICIVHERKASPFENKNMPFPSFSGVWAKLESHNKIMDGLKYANYKILWAKPNKIRVYFDLRSEMLKMIELKCASEITVFQHWLTKHWIETPSVDWE